MQSSPQCIVTAQEQGSRLVAQHLRLWVRLKPVPHILLVPIGVEDLCMQAKGKGPCSKQDWNFIEARSLDAGARSGLAAMDPPGAARRTHR